MNHNIAFLPYVFCVEQNAIKNVAAILHARSIHCTRTLVITGTTNSLLYGDTVAASLEGAVERMAIEGGTETNALSVGEFATSHDIKLLIAVGGGSVIDVVKRVNKLHNIPTIAVPTIVSNDGLMSPISVLRGRDGRGRSLPAAMPIGIIADLGIIMQAPRKHLQAAAGDLLSNLSATSDWILNAQEKSSTELNDIAWQLSRGSAESVIYAHDADLNSERFVRSIITAQIYSGIAMALAGSSRPCSGPEHLISHALDELEITEDIAHGLQVGSICLFILEIMGQLTSDITQFSQKMGIPMSWMSLKAEIRDRLPEIIARARRVRPERRTILDGINDQEFINLAQTYDSKFRDRDD